MNSFQKLDTCNVLQTRIDYLEHVKKMLETELEKTQLYAKADAMLESAFWYLAFSTGYNNPEPGRWDACILISELRNKNKIEKTNDIINKWSKQ